MSAAKPRPRRAPVLAEQVMIGLTLGLVAFGVVMVYSASSAVAIETYGNSFYFLEREGVYAIAGLVALAVFARLDYRRLAAFGPLLVVGSLVLLLLVAVAGVQANGAQRWLPLAGGFTIQPSELAKLALCIYAAGTLASRRRPPGTWREVVGPVGMVTAILCGLVIAERDLGSAIALALVAAAVLLAAGARMGALARCAGVAAGLGFASIAVQPYRLARFSAFLDPGADPKNAGYQLIQASYAFASGGLFGVGLGEGVQKMSYLPEAHTDMIFAIVGEELGLVGVAGLLIAFAALGWAGYVVALRAADPFGKLLAAGVTSLVVGQAIINFGGVLGVLPLTGVPVPLISYGGTSLITTLAGIGLVLSVARHGHAAKAARSRPTTTRSRPAKATRAAAAPAERPRRRTAAGR